MCVQDYGQQLGIRKISLCILSFSMIGFAVLLNLNGMNRTLLYGSDSKNIIYAIIQLVYSDEFNQLLKSN